MFLRKVVDALGSSALPPRGPVIDIFKKGGGRSRTSVITS
jgi:hypothetical protein